MKVRGKKDNRKQGSNGGGVRHGADLLPQTHPKKKKKKRQRFYHRGIIAFPSLILYTRRHPRVYIGLSPPEWARA